MWLIFRLSCTGTGDRDVEFYFESESVDPTRPNSYCTEIKAAWWLTAKWRLEPDEELSGNITFQYIENGAAFDMASVDVYSESITTYNKYQGRSVFHQFTEGESIGENLVLLWFDQNYDTDIYGNVDPNLDGTQFRAVFYYMQGLTQDSAKRVKRANGAANTATADTTSADAMAADTTTADAMAADTSAADAMAADTTTADDSTTAAAAEATSISEMSDTSTTDGATADGTTTDGVAADGTTADGTTADGTTADGARADGTTADGTTADDTTAVSQETHTMDTVTVEESDHVTSDAAQTTEATGHHTEDIAMSTVAAITHDNALSLTTQDDGDGVNIISVDLTIREAVCKS